MSMPNKEVIVIPRMPKKPPPVVYYYMEDEFKTQEGVKASEICKQFKNLSEEAQKKYKAKYRAAWVKYREDVAEWRKKADDLGYIENVAYSGKDIEDVVSKLQLNVDIGKCKELLGKIAGLWVVKIVKAFHELRQKKGKEDSSIMDYLSDEKTIKGSAIFKNTARFIGKSRPTDYLKKANEIDTLEEKVRSDEANEKIRNTMQLKKEYKSNDLNAIMKEKVKDKDKDKSKDKKKK